jgi:methanogenic corrinoid protein MtbC1
MYTIKQASIRTGVGVPLLRAWERRYGIPTPARTPAGYRLYDELALDRVRRMKLLVDSGMSARQAAVSVSRTETAPGPDGSARAEPMTGALPDLGPGEALAAERIRRFLDAAAALDDAGMEAELGESLAAMGVDEALERFVLPAMVAVGDAWARGELSVAAEHAASNAVARRLSALFEAAATPASRVQVIVGLAEGSRHELGALAFAVACRRAGLTVLYLGSDVPLASWLDVVREQPDAAVALGAVTSAEAEAAVEVAAALRRARPETLVAIGGAGLGSIRGRVPERTIELQGTPGEAVARLVGALASRPLRGRAAAG